MTVYGYDITKKSGTIAKCMGRMRFSCLFVFFYFTCRIVIDQNFCVFYGHRKMFLWEKAIRIPSMYDNSEDVSNAMPRKSIIFLFLLRKRKMRSCTRIYRLLLLLHFFLKITSVFSNNVAVTAMFVVVNYGLCNVILIVRKNS